MKVVVDEIFGKSEFLAGYKMAYTLICVALTFFIVYRFNQLANENMDEHAKG